MSRRVFGLGMLAVLGSAQACGRSPSPESAETPVPVAVEPRLTGPDPLFGLNVPYADPTALARLSEQLDAGPVLVSRFVKLDSTIGVADLEETGEGGRRIPVLTLEPWSYVSRSGDVDQPAYSLRSLVEGRHDDALRRIAEVIAGYGHQVLVRFAHEMNADWYPWAFSVNGNSKALYVAAWRHVVALVRSIAPKTRWVWAPVAAWWPDRPSLAGLYPGDDHVDLLGVTGYARSVSARGTFDAWLTEVRALSDRPLLLAEIGAAEPYVTAWLTSLATFLADHDDVVGFVWFNTTPSTTGASGDYRIDDTQAHLAAFRQMLTDTQAVTL